MGSDEMLDVEKATKGFFAYSKQVGPFAATFVALSVVLMFAMWASFIKPEIARRASEDKAREARATQETKEREILVLTLQKASEANADSLKISSDAQKKSAEAQERMATAMEAYQSAQEKNGEDTKAILNELKNANEKMADAPATRERHHIEEMEQDKKHHSEVMQLLGPLKSVPQEHKAHDEKLDELINLQKKGPS